MFVRKLLHVGRLILISSFFLSVNVLAEENSIDAFVGLGPLFSGQGYAQFGAGFELKQTEVLKFSAGPFLGLGFGKNLFITDIGGFARASHSIALPKNTLDIYMKMPAGVGLVNIHEVDTAIFVGLVTGVEFFFHPKFATFLEIGGSHHSVFSSGGSVHILTGILSLGISAKL